MKRVLLFLSFALCVSLNAKAFAERNYLQKAISYEDLKKSLVLNQKWVTFPDYQDREGWDAMTGKYKEAIIKHGEGYLDYEWKILKAMDYIAYETTGERNTIEFTLDANNRAISGLLAAELAEGKGRFIPQLINGLFHTCEMTSWVLSAHLVNLSYSRRSLPEKGDNTLDLPQGAMSHMFAWAYYFLHEEFDKIQPEISRRLYQEIKHRELDSYLTRDDFNWLGFDMTGRNYLNNWTPYCNTNALFTFMLLENDPERLAQGIWKSMRSMDQYLNYSNGDGGLDEGPLYWTLAAGRTFEYLNGLYMITGGAVSLFDVPQIRNMCEAIVRSTIGFEWAVNFADAPPRLDVGAATVYRFGKAVGSELAMGFAVQLNKFDPASHSNPSSQFLQFIEDLRIAKEIEESTLQYTPASYTWYPETEQHNMSSPEGIFLAAKGSHNGQSHNHNDIGSFNLYIDNYPVIIDMGQPTYTAQTFGKDRYSIWMMQSNYHNLPRINGTAQMNGAEYKASDVVTRPGFFSVNIAGAYPEQAKVNKWVRSYSLQGKSVKISDQFSLAEAVEAPQIMFMTWGEVKKSSDGVIDIETGGRKARLKYDSNALDATVETIVLEDPRLAGAWADKVYRIVLTAKRNQISGKFNYTITKL